MLALNKFKYNNKALKWIEEHNKDDDYEEELTIVEVYIL